ncbi:hypothetical protein ES705_26654 [subsurface metagenome]
MTGDILLKLMSVLTADDVRQLKAAGCEADIRACLASFDRMAVQWRHRDYEHLDSQVWANVQIKLNELNAALRG